MKYVTEKIGKFDRKALAETLHGMTITPEKEPGILMETTWDENGDIDRVSFLAEVVDGKQKIVADPAEARQVDPTPNSRQTVGRRWRAGRARPGADAMSDFLQLLVAGLATGGIYALVAIGFSCCGRRRRRSTSPRASSSCCRRSSC